MQVSIDEIRSHNRELADGLLNQPFEFVEAFDRALKDVVRTFTDRPKSETSDDVVYYCAYIGSFGEYSVNPRTLSSNQLNHMVSLEGIVTKTSLVRPKVVKSVHYNETKQKFHYREYRDQTMTTGAASTSVYPTEDEDGSPVCIFWLRISQGANSAFIAHHRIWLLHLPRPPDNFHSRNARTCTCRSAATVC